MRAAPMWQVPAIINKKITMLAHFAEMHLVASDFRSGNAYFIFLDLINSYKSLIRDSGMDATNISTMVNRTCRLVSLMHSEDWFLDNHRDFVSMMLRHVNLNITSFRASHISSIVLALGRLGKKVRLIHTTDGASGNEVLQKLVLASRLNALYFMDRNWASMLAGLALLSPTAQVKNMNQGEPAAGGVMSSTELSGSNFADLPSLHDPGFLQLAVDHISRNGLMFEPTSLTRCLWAFATLDFKQCVPVARIALRRMELHIRDFHITQVSLILWSLAQLHMAQECDKRPFAIQKAMQLCMSQIQEADPHDLSHLVWGCSGLRIRWCSNLFDVVVDEALRKIRLGVKFTDDSVVGLMFSFARYRYRPHSILLDKAVQYMKENLDKLEAPLLARMLYFFAIFGLINKPVIRMAKRMMSQRMNWVTGRDAVYFTWSLAMLDELDVDFLRLTSDRLSSLDNSSATLERKLKKQMYQSFLHLRHVRKLEVPPGLVPENLLACGKEEWQAHEVARGLSGCAHGVLDVLASLGYRVKQKVLIVEGSTVASVATSPDGTDVAVEVVQRNNCFVNDETSVPHVNMWRARLLEALGLSVLRIHETEWTLAGEQKGRYVMRKLLELQQNDLQGEVERPQVASVALASVV